MLFNSTDAGPLPPTTTISCKVAENLERQGVRLPDNRVIYQGIPIEQFPLKEEPGALSALTKLLYVGQLHPYKGVHRLLEAVALVKHPVTLSVAGDGPEDYKAHLLKLAEGIDVKVTFRGRLPHSQLPALYREHDIFIFPSIWEEPFGLTHLEAMASGLPVISTVNGGQGEFLNHQQNCLAIQPDDTESIRQALERLIEEPELAASLAKAGRRTVEERFTTGRYIDELEELLILLRRVHGELGVTTLLATRDAGFAYSVGGVMHICEGRVVSELVRRVAFSRGEGERMEELAVVDGDGRPHV